MHPSDGSQSSSVHSSPSSQDLAVAVHRPSEQTSVVQTVPSPHDVSFGLGGSVQTPVDGLQTPASWQASSAVQVTGAAVWVHDPAWQVAIPLQKSPSSQDVSSGLAESLQTPVDGLQTPASWQASSAVQVTGDVVSVHDPAWQVATPLHQSPSSQDVSSGLAGSVQMPVDGLQTPAS
jgi:hypothetical protein